jgi:capsular polysaccharide biosynthesis protein
MIRRSGIELDSIDHFIVNPLQSSAYREVLNELGVAQDRELFCGPSSVFNVRHLIAPSTLRGTAHQRKWLCDWLNETFAPDGKSLSRAVRLYVGRDDAQTRRVTNQAEIIERVLAPLGFESVVLNGRSIREQAALFSKADVVVGVNGAALSNLVFCKPGTTVIVLHHPIHLSRFFFELSHTVGLDYFGLTGEAPMPADFTSDYVVSPESLAALLNFAGVK